MILQKRLLTSTKNIFTIAASLLCTSHVYSMMNNGTIILKQPQKIHQKLRTYTDKSDGLYEHVAKIGYKHCSDAYETGNCLNPHCSKNLYNAPNTYTKDRWIVAEAINQQRRTDILTNINIQSESRNSFRKKVSDDIEILSIILHKAYDEYLYNGNIKAYKRICELIDHKHHCMLNEIRIVDNENHNLWKICQTFTTQELQTEPFKLHQALYILSLYKEESVEEKSFRLLKDKIKRDLIISKPIEIKKE